MVIKHIIPIEELRARLELDPTCPSHLRWKIGRNKGQPAGCKDSCGYYQIGWDAKRRLSCHRIVWALHNGRWPEQTVDHINRDRGDNRPENLRIASPTDQNLNVGIRKDNRTGFRGVSEDNGKFRGYINFLGKRVWTKRYETAEECAEQVRRLREIYYAEALA